MTNREGGRHHRDREDSPPAMRGISDEPRTLIGIGRAPIIQVGTGDRKNAVTPEPSAFDPRKTLREFESNPSRVVTAGQTEARSASRPRPTAATTAAPPLPPEQLAQAAGARAQDGFPPTLETPPPSLRRTELASSLFREQAILAYERGDKLTAVMRLTAPSSWAFFGAVLAGLTAALLLASLHKVDVIGKGRGILRSPGGAQVVSVALGGTVLEAPPSIGAVVHAQQPILTLDATALRAERMQTIHLLEASRHRLTELENDEPAHEKSLALLRSQSALTQRRLRSEHASMRMLDDRRAAYLRLGERGWVARAEAEDLQEQIRTVERKRLAMEEELAGTQLRIVTLEHERREQLRHAAAQLASAEAKRSSLDAMLAQTIVRAPSAGRLEGLTVRPGDQVQPGQSVARIVPVGPPRQVIAFAEDRDRAFLRSGSPVRIEVDQLPVAEFGVLRGTVHAIGSHFASVEEKASVLGESAPLTPCYRVEIQIDDTPANRRLLTRLQSGALVEARFALRERRLISLVLEPLGEILQ